MLTLNEERPDDIFENKKIVLTIVASVLANPDLKGYTVVIISQLEDEEPSPLGKNKNLQRAKYFF